MLRRPRFKPHLRVESVEEEGVFLLSEVGLKVLTGRLQRIVAPLIDGHRSASEIADLARDQLHPVHVYYALADLEDRGYLVESDNVLPEGEAALWSIQNVDSREAATRLAATVVSITRFGEVQTEPLRAALETVHVRSGDGGDFGVVLTDDYLRIGLAAYNQQCLKSSRPWLLVRPVGRELWLGPLFRPGVTGCWECLSNRLRINRQVECYVQTQKGRVEPLPIARISSTATLQVAWNLAALEIASWIVRRESSLQGEIKTFDLLSWRTQNHVLVRRPQCAVCGEPDRFIQDSVQPVILKDHRKVVAMSGSRTVGPSATLERYGHHVSSITGAVPTLERCNLGLDGALHVYLTGPNFSRPAESLAHLRSDLRNRNSGKGISDLEARASGLCEGLERYSGAFRGDEPRRRAAFEDLQDVAIHPNDCMLFSDKQYEQRELWNATQSFFSTVPMPFDTKVRIDWTALWSLTRQRAKYLPTSFCYFSYPSPPGQRYCVSCSNGCAAGNTIEEAILQGFLEVVERDSVALWWYNRLPRQGVDLASFDEPYLESVSKSLATRNRDIWVLDLTADIKIPVFVALSQRTDCPPARILMGFGAHLDPRIALRRAVTECVQVMASFFPSESSENDIESLQEPLTLTWLRTATLENQPYLAPDIGRAVKVAADYVNLGSEYLKEDVLACQRSVERLGLEMLVLDQTRPDIGLPVVKVVVPGLRHFFARFAPGRLYDLPVQMGWVPQPFAEEQLNPQPMFL